MTKCTCIGCSNNAVMQVKEKETGNILWVCEEHKETINEVVIKEYEPPK